MYVDGYKILQSKETCLVPFIYWLILGHVINIPCMYFKQTQLITLSSS